MGLGGKNTLESTCFVCTGVKYFRFFLFKRAPMVHSCCVIGCTARWSEDDKGFYRIPSEEEPDKRRLWLQSIRRADPKHSTKSWIPSSGDRVCKALFLAGKVSLEFVAVGENYFVLLLKEAVRAVFAQSCGLLHCSVDICFSACRSF